MIQERYLIHGLDALSRAHKTNYFADGHRGAALIAGCCFCRETDLEDGVSDMLSNRAEQEWVHTELCAPFPEEPAVSSRTQEVSDTLRRNISGLREVGHNVIFASLALKAFRQLPEAVTRSRVDGICKLIEAFHVTDVPLAEDRDIPDLREVTALARFILTEWLKCVESFKGRGQGWSGHLLTYGRALLDLRELGHADLADKAEEGFRLYIRRIRLGPQETDKPRPDQPPTGLRPHQKAYWQTCNQDWRLGHGLKYPYGFYGIVQRSGEGNLARQCLAVADNVF